MSLTVRRAENKDIERIKYLLSQVLEIHASIRPDLFIPGTTKYTTEQLEDKIKDDEKPIFVAVDENDIALGHLFCVLLPIPDSPNMHPNKTMYIDDICVDAAARGQHVGKTLYEFALQFAREQGCYDVTLNVWEGNDAARAFYDKMGMRIKETQMEVIL